MGKILLNAQQYSHALLKKHVKSGDIVVDATVGNGHDTVLLAQLVGKSGHVIGVDVQLAAIEATEQRLKGENLLAQCTILQKGHEHIGELIADKTLSAAIFNLGYLPGSDKQITTQAKQTISAITQILPQLKKNGLLILVVYYGHRGGQDEQAALFDFVATLNQKAFTVLNYSFLNQVNSPPHVIVIEKL